LKKRAIVIGLDCASPQLVFDKFLKNMPNLQELMDEGLYGNLKTCMPPITIPAWMVMMTGKSPGKLGVTGFRHRKNSSYNDMWIANSLAIKEPAVWDILGESGKKACLVGVPPTYPPKPINGHLVSCFLTPGIERDYTYPTDFKDEIAEIVGEYIPDLTFRTDSKEELLDGIYEMTEKRFKLIKHMLKNKEWDFFMFVEIGLDRIHHAFWKYYDKEHHLYEPGNKFEDAIPNYYEYIDKKLGEILEILPKETLVLVVSDHGVKRMKGAFCINEWLIEEGLLTLKSTPEKAISIEKADVDWTRTKVWAWGGYYSRVYLNIDGREPGGIVPAEDYESFRDEIAERIKNIKGPNGETLNNLVHKPEDLYGDWKDDYPDLMVFFDDLYWRTAGTIGHNTKYLFENDTGSDDAVHDWHGVFVAKIPGKKLGSKLEGLNIQDVAPTLLKYFDLPIPKDIDGKVIEGLF